MILETVAPMIELPLVFLGGLLGSAHCVGMCGGFALSIGLGARTSRLQLAADNSSTRSAGSSPTPSSAWSPAMRGFWLSRQSRHAGQRPGRSVASRGRPARRSRDCWLWASCRGGSCRRVVRRRHSLPGRNFRRAVPHGRRGWSNVLLAGILTGFLPCGLVYGFLALASSSASIFHGLLTMAAFGAGTAPIMILTGAGGSLLSHSSRRHLLRVSAICVIVTGLISLARGIMFVQFPGSRSSTPVRSVDRPETTQVRPRGINPCRNRHFFYHYVGRAGRLPAGGALTRTRPDQVMKPNAFFLSGHVLALMTMFGLPASAAERRIEIPLEQAGGLPVAEVVSALAQASGVPVERPAAKLTLPTRGLAGSLTKTLLGECLGPEVRLAFRPGVVVIAIEEDELAADRRGRLETAARRPLRAQRSSREPPTVLRDAGTGVLSCE